MNYTHSNQLTHKLLSYGDIIQFKVGTRDIPYRCATSHLENDEGKNDDIFLALGVSPKALADMIYAGGYISGVFPSTQNVAELTSIANVLLQLCEGVDTPIIVTTSTKEIDVTKIRTWKTLVTQVSSDYQAFVYADKIEVGCQTITKAKLEEILAYMNTKQ